MDFHPRKVLKLEKINPSNNIEGDNKKKKEDPCPPPCPNCSDDCKNDSDMSSLFPPLPTPPPPPPPPLSSHHSSLVLVLMLCILGIALFLVSYFSIVRYRSRNSRRRNSQPVNDTREDFIDEDLGPVVDHPIWYIRTVGLQQSVIDSIAVFKYKKDEGLIEGTDCSVCLSEFEEDENLRLLPKCNHAFHIHCIDTWLRSHKNCPLCRAPIVNEANSAQVSVGETNLNVSSDVEENEETESVQNRGEMESHDDVEENRTSEVRTRRESVDSLPIDEKYDDKEMLGKSFHPQPARKNKARVKSDLADHSVKLDEAMEPMRRSLSMDASSAAMVYLVANNRPIEGEGSSHIKDEGCSNVHMVHKIKQNSDIVVLKPEIRKSRIYGLMKSSSFGRSLQKVPLSMKRSFSSSGKSSLPTHSRSHDSNLKL